jgi:hypothetical protein
VTYNFRQLVSNPRDLDFIYAASWLFISSLWTNPQIQIVSLAALLYVIGKRRITESVMFDILLFTLGLALFAATVGYAAYCARL